ncbi:MAG: type II toxin-antitoxin system RelE/ParE family toxin [Lutibacter sp.]|jgi:mRNA interferase RelE/StbE
MQIIIRKSFSKDLNKIVDTRILKAVYKTIKETENASMLSEVKEIKKLTTGTRHYRIKIGYYRIGLVFSNNTVEFIRILHRKDIYRFFPK